MHTQWAEPAIFKRPARDSIATQITDHLRRRIVTGDLPPGGRLPSVKRLSALYGVSAPTVGSAIHALASLGFVRVSRGVGTFVASPQDHMSLLSYVWRAATVQELAVLRATTDARAAPIVAAAVRAKPRSPYPRTMSDVNFLVHERSVARLSDPLSFVRADLDFHRAIVGALRGMEIGPTLYRQVGDRLMHAMLAAADVQAADDALDDAHFRLARAVLGGDVAGAARCARWVAQREGASLGVDLG